MDHGFICISTNDWINLIEIMVIVLRMLHTLISDIRDEIADLIL